MSEESARLLKAGIAAARAGDKQQAKQLLLQATELDEMSEEAWLWLSGVVDDPEEMQICLENVLTINPQNERARKGMAWVKTKLAQKTPPPPPPPPPPPMPFDKPEAAVPPATPFDAPEAAVPPATPFDAPEATFPSAPSPFDAPEFPLTPPPIEEQIAEEPAFLTPEMEEEEEFAPPSNRVPCPSCGTLNYDLAHECVKCSFPLVITCPSCNELVPTETGLCPHCDTQLPLSRKLSGVQEREQHVEDGYRQGLAFLQEGKPQEAKAAFEQILQQAPDHVEATFNLGEACAKLGLTSEAKQHWEEVKLRQPDHPYVDKSLESLVPAQERRRLAREKRKTEKAKQKERKKRAQESTRPEGQSMLDQLDKGVDKKPLPQDDMGVVEAFIYVLMVGLVLGVAYALNSGADLSPENGIDIALKSGLIAAVVVLLWIVLGVVTRLISFIFKSGGTMGSYTSSAARFLFPFFLLLLPIMLNVPRFIALLPPQLQDMLEQFGTMPWYLFGGLALVWGLFLFLRSISRFGGLAMWKALIVGILALAITAGLAYGGYVMGGDYIDTFMADLSAAIATPEPTVTPTSSPTTP